MIRLIEALNYRCLRYVRQEIGPFHVLVGPNASGKTTFLDVISFLGTLVSSGLDSAIDQRTQNFVDLVWQRSGHSFELAIEAVIPEDRRIRLAQERFDTIRYEVSIGIDSETKEVVINNESALLKKGQRTTLRQENLFPRNVMSPDRITTVKGTRGIKTVLRKAQGGNDNFYAEVPKGKGKGWFPSIRLGSRKSALANLPEDEERFPVATWFKGLLTNGIQPFVLNSQLIRKASQPGLTRGFRPDGSNLPWVIERMSPERRREWIAHVQTALPEIMDIRTVEREDERSRYLMIRYGEDLEVPSWMASDGTLRLLALTLPAYLPGFNGVYLVEEPENGIHPRAVETVFQSLSSVYDAQMLLATHSPVILSVVDVGKVLCFKKTSEGATDIVTGDQHPQLKNWRGETNLGTLFAAGVLG